MPKVSFKRFIKYMKRPLGHSQFPVIRHLSPQLARRRLFTFHTRFAATSNRERKKLFLNKNGRDAISR
jgi:hypothetical protein